MQREPSPDVPKLSASMRKGLLDLEKKSRWLRRRDMPALQSVPKPRRKKSRPEAEPRTLASIVRDYKEAVERLEDIEAELSEWLVGPVVAATSRGSPSTDANAIEAPPAVLGVEKTTDSLWTQPLD